MSKPTFNVIKHDDTRPFDGLKDSSIPVKSVSSQYFPGKRRFVERLLSNLCAGLQIALSTSEFDFNVDKVMTFARSAGHDEIVIFWFEPDNSGDSSND